MQFKIFFGNIYQKGLMLRKLKLYLSSILLFNDYLIKANWEIILCEWNMKVFQATQYENGNIAKDNNSIRFYDH